MKYLFILRHGRHNAEGRLSDEGRQDMARVAAVIKELIGDKTVCVLASAAPRADDSASVIAEVLGVPHETDMALWVDNHHPKDLHAALVAIQARMPKADVLVVITHLDYANELPRVVGGLVRLDIPVQNKQYAQGTYIDFAARTVAAVP